MKLTLEINPTSVEEILMGIKTLKALAPENSFVIEGAKFSEGNEKLELTSEETLLQLEEAFLPEENGAIVKELDELKKDMALLREENKSLSIKNKDLQNKIEGLETEIASVPETIDIDSLLDGIQENVDNDVTNNIELENKIKELEKQVSFHESRSNKNFEEVKRLRCSVDNLSTEKKRLESKVNTLEKELLDSKKLLESNNSGLDVESLKQEIEDYKKNKEKLQKEVEFQKNRSKTNWDELRELKPLLESLTLENAKLEEKIKELNINSDNLNSNEDVEKVKKEMIQLKSEYEGKVSELMLKNDKVQNELSLLKTKYSEDDSNELIHLRKVKQAICQNERGESFWNNIERQVN